MADAHAHPSDLRIRMQDGSVLSMQRDDMDRLITTGFVGQGRHQAVTVPAGSHLMGFGAWPGWDANRRQGLLTLADEESGLYEPERLFVLREQYVFVSPEGSLEHGHFISLGPIDKAYWEGTEHVVQARQRSGKH